MTPILLQIDVAHPPLHPALVEEALQEAFSSVRSSQVTRVIKVIHGYGRSGRGGSTREVVRNWAFRMRSRLLCIIPGEEYSRFDAATQRMRAETGLYDDLDLEGGNRGVTYLWVR